MTLVLRKTQFAFRMLRRFGFARTSNCVLCKLFYAALRIPFRFDAWHASAPYACREYKHRVAAAANSIAPRVVVDIGCGLAEVLDHIRAPFRYGIDLDSGAIAAARFLRGRRISLHVASALEPELIAQAVTERPVDLLIMTNWIHGFTTEQLVGMFEGLAAALDVKYLLVDFVRNNTLAACHYHRLEDVAALGEVVLSRDAGDDVRDLHLLKLHSRTAAAAPRTLVTS